MTGSRKLKLTVFVVEELEEGVVEGSRSPVEEVSGPPTLLGGWDGPGCQSAVVETSEEGEGGAMRTGSGGDAGAMDCGATNEGSGADANGDGADGNAGVSAGGPGGPGGPGGVGGVGVLNVVAGLDG
jgi:hypothetical protein